MRLSSILTAATCLAFASAAAIDTTTNSNNANTKKDESSSSSTEDQGLAKKWLEPEKGESRHFPEPKYFKESRTQAHYDARFEKGPLREPEQREAIRILIQTYLSTFRDLGVQTWLMHGTLLGWWWGKQVMPWDLDADVQVTEADMYYLAANQNMTIWYYKYGDMKEGRFFQLEVNPYFRYRGQDDVLNVIDARWIDMQTGLFIDITAARYDPDHAEGEGILYDKSGHEYRDTFVFPLRETTFEGVPANIPYRYKQLLASEYGEKALTNTNFHSHDFDEEEMKWVPNLDL